MPDDVLARGRRILDQEGISTHDHARRAISALVSVVFQEGLLERMEIAVAFKSLDGQNSLAVHRGNGRRTGTNGVVVDDDRARTAESFATSELRAGHAEIFPEHPQQHTFIIDADSLGLRIQGERNCPLHVR